MANPNAGTKVSLGKKNYNDITFKNNVDHVNYTIEQLIMSANKDVGVYLAKLCNAEARKLFRGVNKTRRIGGKYTVAAFQFWARKYTKDLQVGIKHNTWYGTEQELGSSKMEKHAVLKETVYNNIDNIRKIQAQYLTALNNEQKAERLSKEADSKEDGQ